jgi:hypothetical protein
VSATVTAAEDATRCAVATCNGNAVTDNETLAGESFENRNEEALVEAAMLARLVGLEERISGPRTPEQIQASRRRREAARTGLLCATCGRPMTPADPMWKSRGWNGVPFSGRRVMLHECENCAPKDRHWSKFPCEACGRTLYRRSPKHDMYRDQCEPRRSWFCSERCEQAVYRRARRDRQPERPAPKCATCGESFAPIRRDAVTCSSACRQRAYRLRQAAMVA